MARGKTSIIFKGGNYDGTTHDNVSTPLPNNIYQNKGIGFIKSLKDDNSVEIVKFSGKLPDNWLSYSVDVYVREPKKDKRKLGTIYNYKGEEMINRCEAITQKGTHCKHSALEGAGYCGSHKKMMSK